MKHRWSYLPGNPLLEKKLLEELALPPLLARCLANRGITSSEEANEFLIPRLNQLRDPFLLPDMDKAVERLWRARESGESMVLFGDYDVDGVTATTLLLDSLSSLGWQIDWYLPHRMEEGYGLTRQGIENCLEEKPHSLMLAVDCGSNANESIQWLSGQGVDVIVLDHHQVSDPPPPAVALVNPQTSNEDPKPFSELCSAGLAFKLLHALLKHGRDQQTDGFQSFDIRRTLDLVALGTIADIVPLKGENRLLVTAGLRCLTKTERPGLVALKEVAGLEGPINSQSIGFTLGPRLNAAGRMETAQDALLLLLSRDLDSAHKLALQLDTQNRERQRIDRSIADQIIGDLKHRFDENEDLVIVEGELLWHIGVVGIVASKILRRFHRPTFILGGEGGVFRGSGRSIEGFDLAAALRECDDLLIAHGGHAMAAGLTIAADQLPAFRDRMKQIASRQLNKEMLVPEIQLDAEASLAELGLRQLEDLGALEPTGNSNPAVVVSVSNLRMLGSPYYMGKEKQNVRFDVSDGTAESKVVWWNAGDASLPSGSFSIACAPEINEFKGRRSAQLRLIDWRPC